MQTANENTLARLRWHSISDVMIVRIGSETIITQPRIDWTVQDARLDQLRRSTRSWS